MEHNAFIANILELIRNRELGNLKSLLAEAEEMEILQIFYEASAEEQVIAFRLLAKDTALSVFEQLDTDLQQNLLHSFTDEGTAELINEMAPDDRVRLLDEMPAGVAKRLLNLLSAEEREATNVLMGYEDETAGRIMTTEFISLRREMTAEQALEKVRRQASDKESVYTLYVTDNARMLEGVLSLKELICAEPHEKIEDIMHRATSVHTDDDQEDVAHIMQDLDLLAIPVVDREGRMVGIVTIDDAIDILEEEATEDIMDQAGLVGAKGGEVDRSEILVKGSMLKIWRVRMPFLLITLVAAMIAGGLIANIEDVLESIIVVAFFIPLIMDMGGNVGTQSSTVFARGVVLGHIDTKQFFKHISKETGIGLSMGLFVGALAGLIAFIWQGMPELGLAVGVSVAFTMTLAAFLGFLVPWALLKLKLDQAAGSAPIITSIKDIAGLLIYFLSVNTFMRHLITEAYDTLYY
ncbi:MAG: magnesium transporter [Defluviitaleaceae bacterium]|nr:magnesium transporter [Defluviitaleaceae bacterium]